MSNKLSRRNRPWAYPETAEQKKNHAQWKKDFRQGKNRYRIRMLEETNRFFEGMIGNSTLSNISKIDRAHEKGLTTCYHRPAVVKRHERMERYLAATYSGKL